MRLVKPVMGEDEANAVMVTLRAVLDGRLLVEKDELRVRHGLDAIELAEPMDPSVTHEPSVRKTDPATSREAARRAPQAGSERALILRAITRRGEQGYNSWEVAQELGLTGCYWKRVSELEKGGWLRVNGKRRPGKTKVLQQVYTATDAGRAWVARVPEERAHAR